ncbi:MAG: glycine zipper family protein [Burkholderiales bacterium]|nr:glycine zipper family protein [Flavobacterium sp.]
MKKLVLIFSAAMMVLSCKPNANEAGVIGDSKQVTIDSMKVEMAKKEVTMAKQKSIDSMQAIVAQQRSRQVTTHQVVQTTSAEPVAQKRKGWSGAAKGAVIGAGVGAITGAVIDKKKPAQGAIIGGLAGAGLGAGTGAIIDSKKKQ